MFLINYLVVVFFFLYFFFFFCFILYFILDSFFSLLHLNLFHIYHVITTILPEGRLVPTHPRRFMIQFPAVQDPLVTPVTPRYNKFYSPYYYYDNIRVFNSLFLLFVHLHVVQIYIMF